MQSPNVKRKNVINKGWGVKCVLSGVDDKGRGEVSLMIFFCLLELIVKIFIDKNTHSFISAPIE